MKRGENKHGSRRNLPSKQGYTFIELIVVMTIMAIFLLFAMPNHLSQMDRARVATIQNEVMRVENMLEEMLALDDTKISSWEAEERTTLLTYRTTGELYDRDGYVVTVSTYDFAYVPKIMARETFYSELEGRFLINSEGAVYYLDVSEPAE